MSAPNPNASVIDAGALSFATRLSIYFGCIFTVFGVMQPYLNAWFVYRGLSLADVTFIATVTPFLRMVAAPTISFLADRWQAHRRIIVVSGWLYLAAWIAMANGHGLWGLLAAQLLVAAAGAGLIPLTDAMAVGGVKARGLDYGRMRLWGSITFIGASVASGWLVDATGMWLAIWLMVGGAGLTALAGHLLPAPDARVNTKPLALADAWALVRAPTFLAFLIAGGALNAAHSVLNVFSVLHWQSQGLSSSWCGMLWGIGVVSEVLLLAVAGTWLRGVSPLAIMGIGAAASIIRWTALAFDPPLALLIPLQVLHGLTFGATLLGAIQFLGRAVPDTHAGTSQGLYGVFAAGLGGAGGAWLAGVGYQAMAGQAYLLMTALAVVGAIGVLAVARRWDGGVVQLARR